MSSRPRISTIHEGQELSHHPKQLFDTGYVVVIPRTIVYTAHGASYVEGKPIRVVCDVEGKAVQAGMFANSGEEDTNMQAQGGLRQLTDFRIIARQWPGDILSLIWMPEQGLHWPDGTPGGSWLEAVGRPVPLTHGSRNARHTQIMSHLIADRMFADDEKVRRYGFRIPEVDPDQKVWGRD